MQREKPWWSSPAGEERTKDLTAIDRTQYGILLLAVSIVLGPIPYITYIGTFLALIGAILVILGRKAFGQVHSNLVNVSVGIWIFGVVIGVIAIAAYGIDVGTAISGINPGLGLASQPAIAQSLSDAFNNLLIALLVSAAVLGLAQVLITFALQTSTGRVLLVVSYALSLAIGIWVESIIAPQVSAAVSQAITANDLGPLNSLQAQFSLFGLMGIIPASISALAFYLAYKRIDDNVIPDSSTLPAWS